jgi:hypothetical protein
LPYWLIRILELHYASFKLSYCAGGQDPQKKIFSAVGLSAVMEREVTVPCAGISEDHLHVQCTVCHYCFLMEVCS